MKTERFFVTLSPGHPLLCSPRPFYGYRNFLRPRVGRETSSISLASRDESTINVYLLEKFLVTKKNTVCLKFHSWTKPKSNLDRGGGESYDYERVKIEVYVNHSVRDGKYNMLWETNKFLCWKNIME